MAAMDVAFGEDGDCWSGGRTIAECCRPVFAERHVEAADGPWSTPRHCWTSSQSKAVGYSECCPNVDCWSSGYGPEDCCDEERFGPDGNPACWAGPFTHRLCCLAEGYISWPSELFAPLPYDSLYTVESFYTDAQYGLDFGYYSTGRVLRDFIQNKTKGNNFAHFTTFPMVLSPHFARLVCRMLLVSWIALGSPAIMRAVELGAGSGQLGVDVTRCIKHNELGVADGAPLRAWQSAVRYVIVERSPALAARQRSLGLRVVEADAQEPSACPQLQQRFRKLMARGADRGDDLDGPGVLFSNELIDAFAPAKLRFFVEPEPDPEACEEWQEVRVVHLLQPEDVDTVHAILGISGDHASQRVKQMRAVGEELACGAVRDTAIGRAALEVLGSDEPCGSHSATWMGDSLCLPPLVTCISVLLALGVLPTALDLRVPGSAHELRRRLRFDNKLRARLQGIVKEKTAPAAPPGTILLTAESYRLLRRMARRHAEAELQLIHRAQTWKLATPVDEARCTQLKVWVKRHRDRLMDQARLFQQLGYSTMDILVRFGEEGYAALADCLLPGGGFVYTVDYGANFEALVHSSAVSGEDNVVPPMYEIPAGSRMPDCHTEWTRCAGLIDWTTFIDFSNLAGAGKELGWLPVYYGPQSSLEQITTLELKTANGERFAVPGYFSLRAARYPRPRSQLGRALSSWYGNAVEGGQRWASFKLLVQFKKPIAKRIQARLGAAMCDEGQHYCESPMQRAVENGHVVMSPGFPLGHDDMDPCWSIDATQIPLADQLRQEMQGGRPAWYVVGQVQGNQRLLERLDRLYADTYEDLQLAVRLVDWLVATYGCHRLCGAAAESWPLNMSQTARWPMWVRVWNRHRLKRVGVSVLRELKAASAGYQPLQQRKRPFECAARRTAQLLCNPGFADHHAE